MFIIRVVLGVGWWSLSYESCWALGGGVYHTGRVGRWVVECPHPLQMLSTYDMCSLNNTIDSRAIEIDSNELLLFVYFLY